MQAFMEQLPSNSACELPEEMVGLLIESEDLHNELIFLQDDSPS